MFRSSYQNGFLSILYSCGSSPLAIWDKQVRNGYIKRVTDDEVKSLVLEIAGTNVATTFISCPQDPKKVLGIKLPFLIMIIKNMKKYFTFEITILDDKDMHRRFRVSNFQSTTRVRPFCTTMPIGLSGGWNQIQFNLADFTRRAYGSNYVETTRMQIHANCRIRRIYYADRLYSEDEMPEEFKLFLPIRRRRSTRESKTGKSLSNSEKRGAGEGEGLASEPPPFSAAVAEGERVTAGLETSGGSLNPVEEITQPDEQRPEIGRRLSARRGSDPLQQKSVSVSKYDAKRKSVTAVTIKETSGDEFREDQEEEEEEGEPGEEIRNAPQDGGEDLEGQRATQDEVDEQSARIESEELAEVDPNVMTED